ncbi:hypothetical protein DSLASN_06140 [Desulfoluna limicola]|uniref:Peptidase M3A/M3B catalytic domain-containing protein n=1 Tax=Desulfoluna limicola TaxID=2810562 RepID=A0ABM7PCQ8_9BACT|nr:M3 family metallopeptidase [Desulfoluna limicola]BCS94982.1 hypothetical protein DSLASN_06140 [Desulfoluna limicola]
MPHKRVFVILGCLAALVVLSVSCSSSSNSIDKADYANTDYTDVQFPETPEEISSATDTAISKATAQIQAILDATPRTFENTIVAFDTLMYEGYQTVNTMQLLASVSPERDMRDAATTAYLRMAQWFFQATNDSAFLQAMADAESMQGTLAGEEGILVDRVFSYLKAYGLGKSAETRGRLQQANVTSETLKQTILANIVNNAPKANNLPLFADLVRSRAEYASLMGFDTYGAYALKDRMAETPESAMVFIQNVATRLEPLFQAEVARYQAIKISETGDADARITYADISSFQQKSIKERFGVSGIYHEDLFTLENSLDTLFHIAREVFGIEITPAEVPGAVWDDTVRYYQATDLATGAPLGSFYTDLFKREGKNSHPKIMPIAAAKSSADGAWMRPVFVLVFDCTPPEDGAPVYLSMDDAESLFHEFGHALQYLFSTGTYHFTSPHSLGSDFIEVHSQLMEQWLTDPRVMERMFGSNPGLTQDELEQRAAINKALSVVSWRYGIAQSMTDLRFHTDYGKNDPIDPAGVFNTALAEFFVPYPGNTDRVEPLFHMTSPMPSQYYCYLWSQSIAMDLADRFRLSADGFMNDKLGMTIRHTIFEFDACKDPDEGFRSFLGRDWNTAAYLKSFGG